MCLPLVSEGLFFKMRYFSLNEFACKGTGENKINIGFVEQLDKARHIAGIPFTITSGYRTPEHNKAIGASPTSSHLKGLACDISATNSNQRYIIINALLEAGFNRIGINKTFIHVDIDEDKPSNLIFLY